MGRRVKDPLARLGADLDRLLVKLLRDGAPVHDPATGQQAIDAAGNPIFRPPNGSELAVIRGRIRDLANGMAPSSEDTLDQADVMQLLRSTGASAADDQDAPAPIPLRPSLRSRADG